MATVSVRYIVDDVDAAIDLYCGERGHASCPFLRHALARGTRLGRVRVIRVAGPPAAAKQLSPRELVVLRLAGRPRLACRRQFDPTKEVLPMNGFDARKLPRTTVAMSLVLAPLFSLVSALVSPALKSDEGLQLDVIAQHADRWYWFTLLLLVGSILLVPALLGIAALVAERAPRLGYLGGGLAALGALIAIGDVMSQFMSWQMVVNGADHAQMAALLERFDNAGGVSTVFSVGGLAILIGTVLITVGLIRGRVAPAWAAIGLTVAAVVNVAGFSAASSPIVALSWALLLFAMGAIARIVLTGVAQPATIAGLATAHTATEVR
jgi:hypothetical protein